MKLLALAVSIMLFLHGLVWAFAYHHYDWFFIITLALLFNIYAMRLGKHKNRIGQRKNRGEKAKKT